MVAQRFRIAYGRARSKRNALYPRILYAAAVRRAARGVRDSESKGGGLAGTDTRRERTSDYKRGERAIKMRERVSGITKDLIVVDRSDRGRRLLVGCCGD